MNRSLAIVLCCLVCLSFGLGAEESIHVLKKGETLYSLARQYGVTPDAIASANGIDDPRRLKVGQKLVIPAPSLSYTVRKGDTLYGIARAQGVSFSELLKANNLSKDALIRPGQVLAIPGAAVASVPSSTSGAPGASSSEEGKSTSNQTRVTQGTPPTELPPAVLDDPRRVVQKDVTEAVSWPVKAKELAYMEGKLYGVVLTAEKDERVESLTSGTVVSAGPYRGFGQVAIVQADGGYVYVYGGASSLNVSAGEKVAAGARLGALGVDGLSGKPQLFFLVYKDNKPVDPAKAPRG